MEDHKFISDYENEETKNDGIDHDFEIAVDFYNVIVLKIAALNNKYKFITYTSNINCIDHLRALLSITDFPDHSDKVTDKNI